MSRSILFCVLLSLTLPATAQYAVSPVPHDFEDIAGAGEVVLTRGDDVSARCPLGFEFCFYGQCVSELGLSSNGYLTTGATLNAWDNDVIPDWSGPNGLIAPFWSDYVLRAQGRVLVQTSGKPGRRSFVAQWEDVQALGNSASTYTFQVKLFEADGSIEFHYGELDDGPEERPGSRASERLGGVQTIGVEDQSGISGVEIACFQPGSVRSRGPGFRLTSLPSGPTMRAPGHVCRGELVSLRGQGSPGDSYLFVACATTTARPQLRGSFSDLLLERGVCVVGSGILDGTGATVEHAFRVPSALPVDVGCLWQLTTVEPLRPLTAARRSSVAWTSFDACP